MSTFRSFSKYFHCLFAPADQLFSHSLNINTLFDILSYVESCIAISKKVNDLFIIDLNKGTLNHIIGSSICHLVFNIFKKILKGSWDKSPKLMIIFIFGVDAHHCECFSSSCLPVGEDSAIIAYIMIEIYPPYKIMCSWDQLY